MRVSVPAETPGVYDAENELYFTAEEGVQYDADSNEVCRAVKVSLWDLGRHLDPKEEWSVCDPRDEYDFWIGVEIALGRLLKADIIEVRDKRKTRVLREAVKEHILWRMREVHDGPREVV